MSGILAVANGNDFTIEIFEELGQLFLSAFYDTGNLYIIQRTDYRAAGNALDKAKFLPGFGRSMNSLEFVVFT